MINDDEGMNNALEYYREQDKIAHYWGDWADEDPYSNVAEVTNVDSAEEMEEEQDYWDGYDWDADDYTEIWREMKADELSDDD